MNCNWISVAKIFNGDSLVRFLGFREFDQTSYSVLGTYVDSVGLMIRLYKKDLR
jgi:hypothetical protein